MSSLKALQDLIHEKYDIPMSELDPEASMRDKGLDSLALAEFIFAVEDHFHVVVPDDDPSIMSLGGLAAVVDRLLVEKAEKAEKLDKTERASARVEPTGSDPASGIDAAEGAVAPTDALARDPKDPKDAKASTPA